MKVTLICVGKLKEKYWTLAAEEYLKRLSAFCRTEVIEVADEKTPDGASKVTEDRIKKLEGERILARIKDRSKVVALAVNGKRLSSEEFADFIETSGVEGLGHIIFIIGGSLGLSKEVLERADAMISFSDMTFPHQLMRVILLEQIYRGFKINSGQPYHK